ncbi:ATP-dependent 6-phosphofructokinase [Austwickia sp. TVS 96-490-7B]|uniref:6-phosphofructokinase n=1 Tax=Austwickia sp. TVS 96-490-7B TaxID=2830843 RepID=UPI001C56EBEB|nr:6-phosphofructokinase [Austwickia sp. TVS 96-490-7B]MBW3084919.1 ATP-dependent 6-phosphofructokinase [Austwickia sp. TVS 96-490-7B]
MSEQDSPTEVPAEYVAWGDSADLPASSSGGPARIGVLTSGGDAQGMNAAVRAVIRSGLHLGAEVYAITEGWQGAVDGGEGIHAMDWDSVGNVLHRGGTLIGTARCAAFRERSGQLAAARHLLEHGIDRLVVIGGDGSLTGTDEFRRHWPDLLTELVASGDIDQDVADAHPALMIAGLVGSIDNDMVGTDMTIGADSALHRIVDAIDAITSTAASHQRSFVVEVMGRHCGYLPLMAAIAGGCDYVLIPENPPADGWEDDLCETLRAGRAAGRRDSMVLVAEGAADRHGNPIKAEQVKDLLAERLGEDTRVTILGHVQRGGAPSAYDRWMSTLLGFAAVREVLAATAESTPHVLGVRHNRIARIPLVTSVQATRAVGAHITAGDYDAAMAARGGSFREMVDVFATMSRPPTLTAATPPAAGRRVAIMHAGGLAPGMNTAARAAVRLGLDAGLEMLGVYGSFKGLLDGDIRPLSWGDAEGWVGDGGAELGTRRNVPTVEHLYAIGRAIEKNEIDALLLIGGYDAYEAAALLVRERSRYPAFDIPVVCVPASIDNNCPGAELSIGADTALNNAVWALDRIKQSASASRRCFVVETMGRRCGYLALMAGIAGGAERVYLHEEGITLADLQADVTRMNASFRSGRRLYLAVRNEEASEMYTTDFLARLFDEEGRSLFDVRQAVLGHLQQGGSPTPFDRLLATRLVKAAVDDIATQLDAGTSYGRYLGHMGGRLEKRPLAHMDEDVDAEHRRPRQQWWLDVRPAVAAVSQPGAS